MMSTTISVNCPWEITASAPCSMVSLILSCFSSLREICSDTHALLNGLETAIVTQDNNRKRVRQTRCGQICGLPFCLKMFEAYIPGTPDSVNFEGCRRLVSIAALSTC